jgi:hypothetical protein
MNFELNISPLEEIESDVEVILVVNKDFKHDFVQDKKTA